MVLRDEPADQLAKLCSQNDTPLTTSVISAMVAMTSALPSPLSDASMGGWER